MVPHGAPEAEGKGPGGGGEEEEVGYEEEEHGEVMVDDLGPVGVEVAAGEAVAGPGEEGLGEEGVGGSCTRSS